MKTTALLFPLVFSIFQSNAQDITRNNVFVELGGASLFYSINYERLLRDQTDKNIAVRAGFMYMNFFNRNNRTMTGIPVGISWIKPMRKNYVELGITASMILDKYDLSVNGTAESRQIEDLVLMPSIRAGVRHQPSAKGVFWNLLLQASLVAVDNIDDYRFGEVSGLPLLSFGIGYAFP